MTPAQEALKAYFLEKFKAGVFKNLSSYSSLFEKGGVEFLVDAAPVLKAIGEEMGMDLVGQIMLTTATEAMKSVQKYGVFGAFKKFKDAADIQYQRGVERQRQSRRK